MSNNSEKTSFPQAIYFDTNLLISMPYWDITSDYSELAKTAFKFDIKLYSPEVVILELVQRRISNAYDQIKKIDAGCKQLENILKREPIQRENIEGISDTIDLLVREHISEIGITSIPIPENISLLKLIGMSIWKIPPFEKSKEKGFRDSIILFSIIEHLKEFNYTNSIFLTDDRIFQSKKITEGFKKDGLNVYIPTSFKDATNFIKERLDDIILAEMEVEERRLKYFLQSDFKKISDFIIQNISVSERFLEYKSITSEDKNFYGILKEILKITPIEITGAQKDYMKEKNKVNDDIQYILVDIKTKFDVIIQKYNFGFGLFFNSGDKFQATENGRFEKVSTKEDISSKIIDVEMDIYKDVTVEVEVTLEDSNYKEFVIKGLRVW